MTTWQGLIAALDDSGTLLPEWRPSVAAVDRALFVPGAEPERVYADQPVVTQVNDGRPTAEGEFRLATSSSSKPSVMLEMLRLLDVRDGHRVLEIGTGTGYHAAWLSHRLGDGNVTSVEWDATVLATAVANLERAGFRPATVHGDGRAGHPPRAPYDRVICTCTVRDVPFAWVEQCPAGRIVAPWGSSFFNGSYVTLDVAGGRAQGTFSGYPAFMWDRTQRSGASRIADHYHGEQGTRSVTDIPPQHVIQDDPAFFTSLTVTDTWYRWCAADDGSGEATLWFFADDGSSWATVEYVPDARTYEVEQYGPRALWHEVRTQFLRWHALGQPERSHFTLTIDPTGQHLALNQHPFAAA